MIRDIVQMICITVGVIACVICLSSLFKNCSMPCSDSFEEINEKGILKNDKYVCPDNSTIELVPPNNDHKAGVLCHCKEKK